MMITESDECRARIAQMRASEAIFSGQGGDNLFQRRRDELIALDRRRLTLLDIERLQAISGLTKDYLKLNSTPPEVLRYLDGLESARGML